MKSQPFQLFNLLFLLFKGMITISNQANPSSSLSYSFLPSQTVTMSISMTSSYRFLPLYLLSFTLFLHIVAATIPYTTTDTSGAGTTTSSPDPLFHFCSNSGNYTADGSYDKNLNSLMSYLSYHVPPTGFGLSSVGQGEDRVNGLSLCRGDVDTPDCKTCVVKASEEIRKRCPSNKGGTIYYDNCLLRYSDGKFFGTIDTGNRFYMWNINTRNNDSASFNKKTRELITKLSTKAYVSPVFFATGEMNFGKSEKLYGLVQCTRDLSSADCKKCLDDATNELPSCCDAKIGGRVVGASCNFRYELYPFVNA